MNRNRIVLVLCFVLLVSFVLLLVAKFSKHNKKGSLKGQWTNKEKNKIGKLLELELEEVKCSGDKIELLNCILLKISNEFNYKDAYRLISKKIASHDITRIILDCLPKYCSGFAGSWTEDQFNSYLALLDSNPSAYCYMNPEVKHNTNLCMTQRHSQLFAYDYLMSMKGREADEIAQILKEVDGKCILENPCNKMI